MAIPKLSVIIPTYNAENYLENAVTSLINQTIGFKNIELIIIDDKSTDNTKKIILNLTKNYENIVPIFLKENSGSPSKPRNIGIKNSTTEYIMFLDNDDEYYPEMCEKMYSAIVEYDNDIAICKYDRFFESKLNNKKNFLDKDERNIIFINNINEFPEVFFGGFSTMIWNKIYKKNLLLDNNILFEEQYLNEDILFTVSFFLKAKKILILNKFYGYKYKVRNNKDNNKSTSQIYKKENFFKLLNGFLATMKLFKNTNSKYPVYNDLIIDMTKIYMFTDLDINNQKEFLNKMKPYYKSYKIYTKIFNINILFNLIINIFIKLFSFSNYITIVIHNSYTLLSKLKK